MKNLIIKITYICVAFFGIDSYSSDLSSLETQSIQKEDYFKWVLPQSGFSKLIAEKISQNNKNKLQQFFISSNDTYYITPKGISEFCETHVETVFEENIEYDLIICTSRELKAVVFKPVIQDTNNEDLFGYVAMDVNTNPKFVSAINTKLNSNYQYDDIFQKPRKRMLTAVGIEAFKRKLINKFHHAHISSCVTSSMDQNIFSEIINNMKTGSYLLCTYEYHSNLLCKQNIDDMDYYFIFDSVGYSNNKSRIENQGGVRETVSGNFKLMLDQARAITHLNKNVVVGCEHRQKDGTSCTAFMGNDLETALLNSPNLFEEILKSSTGCGNFYMFKNYPASMLSLCQYEPEKNDSRLSEEVLQVVEQCNYAIRLNLGQILEKHYLENGRFYNTDAQKIIESFCNGDQYDNSNCSH
ncbi:MAG: hypothetical protein KC505_01500 [Myxococcales bacterium]|nr:hypothetical protein [Myxococcales bacterium]USN51376.1 MAG: hypothetical protein H6731_02920 [Myxococcales bacterium]